jgi:heme A synthase
LLLLQIALGILTIWSGRQPLITTLHVLAGAYLLALTWLAAVSNHLLGRIEPNLPQPLATGHAPCPTAVADPNYPA